METFEQLIILLIDQLGKVLEHFLKEMCLDVDCFYLQLENILSAGKDIAFMNLFSLSLIE
jgi:hypothetical protein